MQTSEINQRFVEYYEAESYQLLPRAPMVDDSIPMSFVMSAGLVQVEQSLTRAKIRESNKFVLVQDCFRHFDLNKVGTDDIHLSIFEMPGAFRFGPIRKMDTIQQMWELATLVFGIDERRLWATYFRGGNVLGNEIPADNTARQAWLDVGLSSEHIVGLGAEDNYWLQGKGFNGGEVIRKSGPNTELFFDRGIDRSCSAYCQPSCKCGRFIEFSNSLFILYEVDPRSGHLKQLDDPFSETVIGTERIAMILQGHESVFDIDKYHSILKTIEKYSQVKNLDKTILSVSKRVIADHLRALYLLVADGAPPPGKNGRERIIKLLIRGILTRQMLLGITDRNFFSIALKCIANLLPNEENRWAQEQAIAYFESERERFLKTVEIGIGHLHRLIKENALLSGEQIVYLQKKKGLPPLLSANFLDSKGIPFPEAEYRAAIKTWHKNQQ